MRYFYSFIQKIIEFINANKNGSNILMFHQVNDDREKWYDSGCAISKRSFIELIDGLLADEYNFYSIDELEKHTDSKSVFLTFDDIYADAAENAFPYLIKKNIPFCVFISESYIDKKDFISSKELETLIQEPLCTIGYHTKAHKLMRNLNAEQIEKELGCAEFEKRIGKRAEFFAFPYGSVYACSKKSIDIAKTMGYKYIFSTLNMPCSFSWFKRKSYFLPRINVSEMNYRKIMGR